MVAIRSDRLLVKNAHKSEKSLDLTFGRGRTYPFEGNHGEDFRALRSYRGCVSGYRIISVPAFPSTDRCIFSMEVIKALFPPLSRN